MKASCKQLKIILASGIQKLDLALLITKLNKFLFGTIFSIFRFLIFITSTIFRI